jgi:hypothetical protein
MNQIRAVRLQAMTRFDFKNVRLEPNQTTKPDPVKIVVKLAHAVNISTAWTQIYLRFVPFLRVARVSGVPVSLRLRGGGTLPASRHAWMTPS